MIRKDTPDSKKPSDHLRGLTVGAGFFSRIQMQAWRRLKNVQIVAVCDLDKARAQAFAREWDLPCAYTDAEEALEAERPDFFDIVTPPGTHLELARLACQQGSAVLCQKPLAPGMKEAEQLVALCAQHDVRLMVNENWRWQRWYREIHGLIQDGTIGEPFYARFVIRRGDGRGENPFAQQPYFRAMKRFLLFETLVHFIDTSRFLWGEINTIHATLRRVHPEIAGEDMALITLGMKSGMTVLIDANRFTDPPPESARTFGTLVTEGREGQIELRPDGSIWVLPHDAPAWEHPYRYLENGYFGDGCFYAQGHFLDCLRSGADFETSGWDYLKTFRAVWGGYESGETNRVVSL